MVLYDPTLHLILDVLVIPNAQYPIYRAIHFPLVVLSLLGIGGNIISLIVWTRPQLKSSSAILLTALAACDLVVVLIIHSTTTLGIMINFIGHDYDSPTFWKLHFIVVPHFEIWVYAIFDMAQTASMYLTLAITLERYIAVCHPFHLEMICTYSRAFMSAASIIIFSILFNLCKFWERRLEQDDGMTVDGWKGYCWIVEIKMKPLYESVYRIWLNLIINYLLPLAGVVILNTAVYLKLKIANRERQTLTNLQKYENRLTRMLICVVVEFLVCTSVTGPIAVWNTFDAGSMDSLFTSDVTLLTLALSAFFNTINSSVNVVTYVTYRGPFRKMFVEMFCSCCKESAQPMLPARPTELNRTNDTEDTPV